MFVVPALKGWCERHVPPPLNHLGSSLFQALVAIACFLHVGVPRYEGDAFGHVVPTSDDSIDDLTLVL